MSARNVFQNSHNTHIDKSSQNQHASFKLLILQCVLRWLRTVPWIVIFFPCDLILHLLNSVKIFQQLAYHNTTNRHTRIRWTPKRLLLNVTQFRSPIHLFNRHTFMLLQEKQRIRCRHLQTNLKSHNDSGLHSLQNNKFKSYMSFFEFRYEQHRIYEI